MDSLISPFVLCHEELDAHDKVSSSMMSSPLSGTGHTFQSGIHDRAPPMVWYNLTKTTKTLMIIDQIMHFCLFTSEFCSFSHFFYLNGMFLVSFVSLPIRGGPFSSYAMHSWMSKLTSLQKSLCLFNSLSMYIKKWLK